MGGDRLYNILLSLVRLATSNATARRAILCATLQAAGCAAPDTALDTERIGSVSTIAVHPLEAPPLEVTSRFLQTMYAMGAMTPIIGGIWVIANNEQLDLQVETHGKNAELLDTDAYWLPTRVVAGQVIRQLREQGAYQARELLPMTPLYAGIDDPGMDLYQPVRAWYNGDRPTSAALSADTDLVIEVGIWNYAYIQEVLAVAVVLRAVDPRSGEVLGRARSWDTPSADTAEVMFANDAQAFKSMFTATSDRLVGESLRRLGLL